MMKKLSMLVLLIATCLAVGAQNSVLGKINKIKTDKDYIYGEATLSTEDDARELANEMLVREANNWASHVCDTEDVDLDADAVTELAESLDLPRGNMVRVFVYVKKKALMPVLEDAGLEIAESSDEEEAAEEDTDNEEEVAIEMTEETIEFAPEAEEAESVADGINDTAGSIELGEAAIMLPAMETIETGLAETADDASEALTSQTNAATPQVEEAVASPMMNEEELLDAYLFGSAMMSSADQKAAEQVAAKKAAAIKPLNVTDNDVLNKICGVTSFYDLKSVMVPFKKSGKITRLGKYTTMDEPTESYLIIYDTNGYIRAVLGKGSDSRENLKTKKEDTERNYKGCGAIWFQLNED